jgi:hypothetical protein
MGLESTRHFSSHVDVCGRMGIGISDLNGID